MANWLRQLRGADAATRRRAAILVNDAAALSAAGRHAEAVAAGREATGLLRGIGRAESRPLLARALVRLSDDLATVGDHAEALRTAEEGLTLTQELADLGRVSPESAAMAEANFALRLLGAGRAEEALPYARTAAAAGTAEGPPEFRSWFLGTLSQVLAAAGHDAESLTVSEQARAVLALAPAAPPPAASRSPFAATPPLEAAPSAATPPLEAASSAAGSPNGSPPAAAPPDGSTPAASPQAVFRPVGSPPATGLARADERAREQVNHANRLLRAGRWQEAAETSADAVARFRALTGHNLRVYLPRLATALTNHALMLAKVARWEESLAASEEAVMLQREVSAADPMAGRAGLASALSAHAIGLTDADRITDARTLMAESVEIYRALVAGNRDAYQDRLAEAVSNYAVIAQTPEERLRLTEEVVRLRRELTAQNRAVHLPWLARSLDLLADTLSSIGRHTAAIEAGAEAVKLAREAFHANRDGFLPHQAYILREQANRLDRAGRPGEAVALGTEAVETYRASAAANPPREVPSLAIALNQQAARLSARSQRGSRRTRLARALQAEAIDLLSGHDHS